MNPEAIAELRRWCVGYLAFAIKIEDEHLQRQFEDTIRRLDEMAIFDGPAKELPHGSET